MTIRTLQEADAERLLVFWNRNVPYDLLTPELLFEKVFDDHDYDPSTSLVAEEDGRLLGFIQGVVRNFERRVGYVKLLAVEETFRRRGIATQLLDRVEKQMQQEGAAEIRVLESSPNYLQPGLDPRYTEAVVLFERRGYERFGETANMDADLSSPSFETREEEDSLSAQGFEIRRARRGDEAEIAEFLEAHFPAWGAEVGVSLSHDPATLHLALKNGRVVGFAAYDANNIGTGWFGPMGTDPAVRGKGIGGVLLLRCLKDIQEQGHRSATIAWVGPISFYLHYAGARVSRVFWRYRKVFKTDAKNEGSDEVEAEQGAKDQGEGTEPEQG